MEYKYVMFAILGTYTVRIFTRDISRTQRLRVKVRCYRVKLRWKYWIKWSQIKARLVRINLYDSWVKLRKVGSFITQYWLDQMGPNQSTTCQDQFVWFLGQTTKSWEFYHTILVGWKGPKSSTTCQDQFVRFLGQTTKSWEYYHTILVEFY